MSELHRKSQIENEAQKHEANEIRQNLVQVQVKTIDDLN